MSSTSRVSAPSRRYHPDAYRFVFASLQYTQEKLQQSLPIDDDAIMDESGGSQPSGHISGGELLDGIREYSLVEFGLLARTVFQSWNVKSTRDFGEIVFELVERGEMRATDDDCIDDFDDVFDFHEALELAYRIPTNRIG